MLERVPHDEGSRDPAFAPRSETIRARVAANAEDSSPMGSPPLRGQGAGASGMTRRVLSLEGYFFFLPYQVTSTRVLLLFQFKFFYS